MSINAAVIGCGFQGRLHVEFLSQIKDVNVVAVADTDLARLNDISDRFSVENRFLDYRDMLNDRPYDLVTICTMPVHHAEMTVAAFERGAHVLCEKPLALNSKEGARMTEAASRAGKVLGVGYNMRFTPNAQTISNFIESGKFGRPVKTRAWAKASQIPWWGEHYRKEISGGGALAATAVHFLDLALYFAGFPNPVTVSASSAKLFPTKRGHTAPDVQASTNYNAEDIISAHVRFDNGFWLDLEGSWIDNQPSIDGEPSWDYSLDAVGADAQVWFDPLVIRTEKAGKIFDELPANTLSDVSFPPSVAALIDDFVGAVRDNRAPLVTGDQALRVQNIVDAIYESASLGKEISLHI